MKIPIFAIVNIQVYQMGQTYNFSYWKNGKLLDVRGTITKITWSHVTITVEKED